MCLSMFRLVRLRVTEIMINILRLTPSFLQMCDMFGDWSYGLHSRHKKYFNI
jgi:hypothetical protein